MSKEGSANKEMGAEWRKEGKPGKEREEGKLRRED